MTTYTNQGNELIRMNKLMKRMNTATNNAIQELQRNVQDVNNDQSIDGGFANSTYLPEQNIDGGNALNE